jgi:hypothetical protein
VELLNVDGFKWVMLFLTILNKLGGAVAYCPSSVTFETMSRKLNLQSLPGFFFFVIAPRNEYEQASHYEGSVDKLL